MSNEIEQITKLVQDHPKNYGRMIKSGYPDLLHFIEESICGTPIENDPDIDFSTKVYWAVHGLKKFPVCKICGKPLRKKTVQNFFLGYGKYCERSCQVKDPDTQKTTRETCLKRYGVTHYLKTDQSKKERIQYWNKYIPKKRYPTKTGILRRATPLLTHEQRCEIQKKAHKTYVKTMKERYGVENSGQMQQHTDGIKRFLKDKDRVAIARKKATTTMKQRYGVETALQVHKFRLKQQQKYFYENKWFDSGAEIYFYIYHRDMGDSIEYQPDVKLFYEFKGKTHRYYPDFLLNGQLIELKGDHLFNDKGELINPWAKRLSESRRMELFDRDQAKLKCMKDGGVKIVLYSQIEECIDYCKKIYGYKYVDSFKRRSTCHQ